MDQVLAELRARVDSLAADRDKLSEQKNQLASQLLSAIRRTNELGRQVEHLSASAGSADGLSERIRVILELACAEADAMTAQARELLQEAKAHHDEAQADAVRILSEARTAAKAVVDQARRAAAGDVDQLRRYLLAELPPRLNAVIDDALGHLPESVEGASNGDDSVEAGVIPQQRQPQTDSTRPVGS